MAVGVAGTPRAATGAPIAWLMGSMFVVAWAVVVYNVTQVSFRQRLCPRHLLGRMNASIRFLVWGTMPLDALAGGALGAWLGVLPALWVLVGIGLTSTLPVLLSPLRSMRLLPRELDALADS